MNRFIPLALLALFPYLALAPIFSLAEETQTKSTVEKLAFVSHWDGNANIYVVNVDGSQLVKLTTGTPKKEGFYTPKWSPDASKLITVKNITHSLFKTTYELWLAHLNGAGLLKIAENIEPVFLPSWSPDGTKVLFVIREEKKAKIKIFDLLNNSTNDITPPELQEIKNSNLTWSPDSAKILGVFTTQSKTNIYYLKIADLALVKVTAKSGAYENPVWSPDGAKIIFAYTNPTLDLFNQDSGLYSINSDGSNLLLIDKGEKISNIAWASDSTTISYSKASRIDTQMDAQGFSSSTYYYGTFLYSTNGTGHPQKLFNSGKTPQQPSWSPDGKKLAFILGGAVNITLPGEAKPVIIKIPNPSGTPVWSPDSTQIACTGSDRILKKSSIYLAPINGGKVIRLTDDTQAYDPVWAP